MGNMNTTDKFYWCMFHPNIGLKGWEGIIEIVPQMVNPDNDTIESDKGLNTKQQWWIEYSKFDNNQNLDENLHTHYSNLDCGGDTIDEAVDNLYKLMLEQYGDWVYEG